MKPKLSIIVPVFNMENYLERCVNSILNQTFKDFELILINDGSTDASGIICDSYANMHQNIKVIHKQNKGLGYARNSGIDVAEGEFIGFIDSDDWVSPHMYEKLIVACQKYQADIASCNYKKINNFENSNHDELSQFSVFEYGNIDSIISLYKGEHLEWIVCNKIFKRKLLIETKFENVKILEDVLIIPKLFFYSNKIVHIDVPLYYYYQRPGSIINSELNFQKFQGSMEVFNKLIYFFKDKKDYELVQYAEQMFYSSLINWKIRLERKKLADKNFNQEIKNFLKSNSKSFLENKLIPFKMKVLLSLSFISLKFITFYGKANSK